MNDISRRPAHPSFWEAFVYWLKLGFISFGGPAGQISIMHQELVEKRRWISERRFLHALNYCMVLPGPEAQQLAIYIGWLLHRTWGGIIAGTLFVLPSLFILTALTYVYLAFGDITFVQGVFNGIKPAVVAIVVFAAWRIGSRALKNNLLWVIAAASFIAIFALKIPFPYIVLGAGILGFIGGKVWPDKFKVGGGHGASSAPLVESTHGDLKFTAPLTGITAAVVGVVLNLALFFGWHVIWPRATEAAPFSGGFEWFYALISVAAFIALWKYKQDIMKIIAACASIGLAYTLALN